MGLKFNGNPTTVKTPPVEAFFDADFHPNKDGLLALSTVEGNVHFVDVIKETTVLTLDKWHKGSPIRKVRFSPDGKTLVTGAKVAKLYDLDAGVCTRKLEANHGEGDTNDRIYSLLVADHFLLCTGHDSGAFNLWDYRTESKPVMTINECSEYISDMDINEAKRIVAASSGEGTLTAFNIRARRMEKPQSELFDSSLTSVCFLDNRSKLLVGSEEGTIEIFNCGEWGNISTRYPIKNCGSVTCIKRLVDSTVLVGDDNGNTLVVNVLPSKVFKNLTRDHVRIGDKNAHKASKEEKDGNQMPIETIAVQQSNNLIVSVSSQSVIRINYEETSDAEAAPSGRNDFFADLVEEEEDADDDDDSEEDSDGSGSDSDQE